MPQNRRKLCECNPQYPVRKFSDTNQDMLCGIITMKTNLFIVDVCTDLCGVLWNNWDVILDQKMFQT